MALKPITILKIARLLYHTAITVRGFTRPDDDDSEPERSPTPAPPPEALAPATCAHCNRALPEPWRDPDNAEFCMLPRTPQDCPFVLEAFHRDRLRFEILEGEHAGAWLYTAPMAHDADELFAGLQFGYSSDLPARSVAVGTLHGIWHIREWSPDAVLHVSGQRVTDEAPIEHGTIISIIGLRMRVHLPISARNLPEPAHWRDDPEFARLVPLTREGDIEAAQRLLKIANRRDDLQAVSLAESVLQYS